MPIEHRKPLTGNVIGTARDGYGWDPTEGEPSDALLRAVADLQRGNLTPALLSEPLDPGTTNPSAHGFLITTRTASNGEETFRVYHLTAGDIARTTPEHRTHMRIYAAVLAACGWKVAYAGNTCVAFTA